MPDYRARFGFFWLQFLTRDSQPSCTGTSFRFFSISFRVTLFNKKVVGNSNIPPPAPTPAPTSTKKKKYIYTSSREEEDATTNMCPCGTTLESRTHIVGRCEIYKEEWDALEMRKFDVCDMEEFGRLESSEKTIAILGDRWWPQTAKQDGDRMSKQFLCNIWKKRNERPNVGDASISSRNGAPSRKGRVVNGQMTKASNK